MKLFQNKNIILFSITFFSQMVQAISFSDAWDKAKNKMYSAKESVSKKWDNLDESTKNAIIGASVATAATAVATGAGYAGYNAYQNQPSSKNIVNDPTQSRETLDQLITFLSTDPNYANRPDRQKSFLNRFDISDDQKSHLFDIIQYEENLKK